MDNSSIRISVLIALLCTFSLSAQAQWVKIPAPENNMNFGYIEANSRGHFAIAGAPSSSGSEIHIQGTVDSGRTWSGYCNTHCDSATCLALATPDAGGYEAVEAYGFYDDVSSGRHYAITTGSLTFPAGCQAFDSRYNDAFGFSSDEIMMAGDGGLDLHNLSTDIYDRRLTPQSSREKFYSVTFSPDRQYGYAGTNYGLIYKSIDRGVTWHAAGSCSTRVQDLSFPTCDTGYAATEQGIYVTYNAGTSWQPTLGHTISTRSVSFWDSQNGFCTQKHITNLSTDTTTFYRLKRTRDGGRTWHGEPFSYRRNYSNVSCTSEGFCYVVSNYTPDTILYYRNPNPRVVTATKPQTSAQRFQIAPNPAHNHATLTGIAPATRWRLLTTTGAEQLAGKGPGNLPLQKMPPGLYLLLVEDKSGWQTQKLVVE